jgi:uncharacterized OsmC-like protein
MTTLREYLLQKRDALLKRRSVVASKLAASTTVEPHVLKARVRAEGRSGIRHIQIRQHHIISDSDYSFAGYDLGPGSPEIQMGVLGSCLTHIYLIHAADLQIPLDSLEVEVTGEQNPAARKPGYENVPIYPHNIRYTVHVSSPASSEQLAELHEVVEQNCPILNLLINPQRIIGNVVHTPTEA